MARRLYDAAFWLIAAAAFAAGCVLGLDIDALPRDGGWLALGAAVGMGLLFGPRGIVAAVVASVAFGVMTLVEHGASPEDGENVALLLFFSFVTVLPAVIGIASGAGALVHLAVRWLVRLGARAAGSGP